MRLGDLFDLKYGYGLTAQNRTHGKVPVYGSSGVVGFHDNAAVNTSGVVIGRKGNVGAVHYSPVPFYPIDTVYFVDETKSEDDLQFLYYLLSRVPFKRIGSDVGVPGLSRDLAYQLEVVIPEDINEQKRIAGMLAAFDEKIENNNRIIKALEEMAQAIYKEWFVGFRFPGHEKAEFIDSELGRIPKGWEVKRFSDIAHLNKGVSYSSKEIAAKNGGLPMINLANFLRGGGFNANGIKHYTGEHKDSHLVKPGQIVIAMTDLTSNREVIGHPARVPEDFEKALISLDVCSVSTEDIYVEFLYSAMLRRDFSQLMAGSASGTNVSHLSKTNIENYILILPDTDLLSKFNDLIRPMFTLQINLEAESRKLAAMRDLLLPRLMSGEIRV